MDPLAIIKKYYNPDSEAYYYLTQHGQAVAKKALASVAKIKNVDLKFLEEAALLHDIGIIFTNATKIGCHGEKPYICHGLLGREILEKENLSRHALVCEHHVGGGLTKEEIIEQNLPLPQRDMLPQSVEEEIICFADRFFSKDKEFLTQERSLDQIRQELTRFNPRHTADFEKWLKAFGP